MDLVGRHLETLRIFNLTEWDVLAFICRHGTSLASAEQIARLLGYGKAAVGAALDSLTSIGLVKRSRNSRGVRLYQSAPAVSGDPRQSSLEELIKVAEERQGRLLLIGHLQRPAAGEQRSARRFASGLRTCGNLRKGR
jgi:biotin operon repressor